MPSDPAALLLLAAKKNGLQNAGSAPWHLKATYELLNEKGAAKETGTFEEWWVSARRFKKSYKSQNFTQTDYFGETGLLRAGNPESPNWGMAIVSSGMFPWFPSQAELSRMKLVVRDQSIRGAKLKCIAQQPRSSPNQFSISADCLGETLPVLRLSLTNDGMAETVYNEVVSFRGAYVPRDFLVSYIGKPYLHVHYDLIESLTAVDQRDFIAPTEAILVKERMFGRGNHVVPGQVLHKQEPTYPAVARQKGVEGAVLVHAVIGRDGKVLKTEALTGPPLLIDEALRTVQSFIYSPFTLDGQPVEVDLLAQILFSMRP